MADEQRGVNQESAEACEARIEALKSDLAAHFQRIAQQIVREYRDEFGVSVTQLGARVTCESSPVATWISSVNIEVQYK